MSIKQSSGGPDGSERPGDRVHTAPGPHLWRILRAAAAADKVISGKEYVLYTDATIASSAPAFDMGSCITITLSSDGSTKSGALGGRIISRVWEYSASELPLRPEYRPTAKPEQFWLGLNPDEELAALMGLALGIRVRSGGEVRRLSPDPKVDDVPTGEFLHQAPVLLPPLARPGRPIISDVTREIALDEIQAILPTIANLSAADAVALVRAACVYVDALWVADHDPELAWLHLITALELIAGRFHDAHGDPTDLLASWNPELVDLLQNNGGDALVVQAAVVLSDYIGSIRKLAAVVSAFPVDPPDRRTELKHLQLKDWHDVDDIVRRVKKIYNHRSKRLHSGVSFPAPLLFVSIDERAEHLQLPKIEPGDHAFRSAAIGWKNSDIPITLHAFAHLTRGVLLGWWRSTAGVSAL